jgi:hypothetical protein
VLNQNTREFSSLSYAWMRTLKAFAIINVSAIETHFPSILWLTRALPELIPHNYKSRIGGNTLWEYIEEHVI